MEQEKSLEEKDGETEEVTEEVECFVDEEDEEDVRSVNSCWKLWGKKNFNPNTLNSTLSIWNLKHGLETKHIGDNMFTFQFFHCNDKMKVLENQPSHFDCQVLCLSEIEGDPIGNRSALASYVGQIL